MHNKMEVIIRELKEEDLFQGFLESLDSLKKASEISKEKAKEIFDKIEANSDQVIFVAELNGRIIGSTTLLLEYKFIHNGSLIGHIEDVVVTKEFQGRGVGRKLTLKALDYANKKGCYKTILDCSEDVRIFYEKLGFKIHGIYMRFDHDK